MITKSLIAKTKHVWSRDPALDTDHKDYDWAEFIKTGDMKYVPAKEGMTVAEFEIGPLTRMQFLRVWSLSDLVQANEAVAYGLKGLTGYKVEGVDVELEFQNADDGKRLNKATLDRIFEPLLFMELGMRIIELSRLSPLSAPR